MRSDPAQGLGGAILGYPENGPFDVQPGRIGRTQTVITQDAYGQGPVSRLLTPLRGLVRPGNSGGPLVDGEGHVLDDGVREHRRRLLAGGYGVANATVATSLAEANDTCGPARRWARRGARPDERAMHATV